MDIVQIKTEENIKKLADLASEIWHEFFPSIISLEQIDYMLENFQSEKALFEQLKSGYEYYFIGDVGYFGCQVQSDKLFLSKLYIKKSERGKGYSKLAFEFLKELCKNRKLKSIYLTVNKYNTDTIAIYKKLGFRNIDSIISDIGNNFIMDDFIFEYKVPKTSLRIEK